MPPAKPTDDSVSMSARPVSVGRRVVRAMSAGYERWVSGRMCEGGQGCAERCERLDERPQAGECVGAGMGPCPPSPGGVCVQGEGVCRVCAGCVQCERVEREPAAHAASPSTAPQSTSAP
eukprot:248169-Prymnesium_polylepis.1